jgi:hypothetical protein
MAFNNFTVSVVSFNETAGVDWTIAQPSVSLIITPNTGYTVTAADFSVTNTLPTYVANVTFTQNGNNIDCIIVYNSPMIMPPINVFISLCIKGSAVERQICVAGVVSQCDVSNNKLPLAGDPDVPYVACGSIGSTSTVVASYQVIAESTYYYPTAPTLAVVIGDPNNYTITDVKSYDAAGNIIAVVFTVTYTFPLNDVIGDKICLTANAVVIYNPPVKITSYSFTTGSTISSGGQTTNFIVNGIEGANWVFNMISSGLFAPVNVSGTIDATGTHSFPVTFPAVTIDTTYTVTLTGDLASTFCTVAPYVPCSTGQPSVFTLQQLVNTTLGLRFTTTNSNIITPLAISSQSFEPGIVPSGNSNNVTFDVVAVGNSEFSFNGLPAISEWTNQSLDPPLYDFEVQSHSFIVDNNTNTLTGTVNINIDTTGTPSVISELDIDAYLGTPECYSAIDCTAVTTFLIDLNQGWVNDPSTGLSQITTAYNINDVVVVKDTINGTEYCVRITGTAPGTPTTFINTAVNNGTGVYGTCNQCDEL